MIRNVILDWSGTLVDDLPAVLHASNFVFRQAGVPEMTVDQFRAEFCLPFKKFYDRYIPHVALTQLEAWFHVAFREAQDRVTELPHARQFLEFCRASDLRSFLLSSVHRDHFAVQSARTGFGALLDRAYIEIWDKRGKIRELLQEHQFNPRETMFVGDMEHDIETARAGGVYACAVLTGYNHLDQLRAAQPDLIVEHLGELKMILAQCGFDLEQVGAKPVKGSVASAQASSQETPIATVGSLIFDDVDRVLMIRTHKWSDLWGIPGGKIKVGETAGAALRREIKEETNLEIDDIQFVLPQDCIRSPEFFREAHFVLLNYTSHAGGAQEVKLNAEAQEFRWLTLDEALQLPLNTPTRILIDQVKARRKRESAFMSLRASPDRIRIEDLEVFYQVGVPAAERAKPQRLLLTLDLEHDFKGAAANDDLRLTIDYHSVTRQLLRFGEGRSWKLIEKLASDLADFILREFKPRRVAVEVKKFILPETRHVSVRVIRTRG